jgi:hypothetical protein
MRVLELDQGDDVGQPVPLRVLDRRLERLGHIGGPPVERCADRELKPCLREQPVIAHDLTARRALRRRDSRLGQLNLAA